MATKTINTRIGLKYDSYSAWEAVKNSFIPIRGEVIFYEIPAAAGAVVNEPAILFKVGDGVKTLAQLPWGSAIAADVYSWAKQQSLLGGTENNGIWTWSSDQAYAMEQAEVAAFVHKETASLLMKVDQVTAENFQSIYGRAYNPETDANKIGKYQISVSTDNGSTWTPSGEPFAITIEDYSAGDGLTLDQNNEFSINLGNSNDYLEFGQNGELQATAVTAVYTPAVPATEGVHWTQEEIESAEPGDDAYGKTTEDWKVAPVAGSPATITAGSGLLTGDSVAAIKNYVDAKSSEQTTAGAVTVEKLSTANTGYASTYVVKQGGVQVGAAIDIPKDFLVKSATLSTVETADEPYAGAVVGEKYIDFTVNTTDSSETATHIYLPVKDLVDVYTGGSTNYAVTTVDGNNVITTDIQVASVATAHGTRFSFTSYSAETGGTQYGTGTAEVTGTTDDSTTVKVLTNTVDGWAGRTFTVDAVEPFSAGTRYHLKENGTEIPVWVEITSKTDSTDGIAVASDVKQYVDSQIAVATPNIAAGNGIAVATVGNNVEVAVLLDETNSTIANNAGSGLVVSQDGLRIDDSLEWHLECGGAPSQS